MPPLVVLHIPFSGETLATETADKRLLFCVNSDVNYEVRSLGKRFLATIERAPKRLSSLMKVHMCLKSTLSRKTFSTSDIHAPISRSATSQL